MKSIYNFKVSEVLWRQMLRNNEFELEDMNSIKIEVDDLEIWIDYDYYKNTARTTSNKATIQAKEIIKKCVYDLIENSKIPEFIASKEAQRFEKIHSKFFYSKKKAINFKKEIKEAGLIRDDINLILSRYNSDSRAPKDFQHYMGNFIKMLRLISPREV
ncbi:MAG: hypothetical protein KKE50_02045, partial [Nanoarchaeota archaeon]|nr:hypothetical protein [Nanoarchaeota archaeon]